MECIIVFKPEWFFLNNLGGQEEDKMIKFNIGVL